VSSYATLTDLTTLGVPSAALSGVSTVEQQRALDAASTLADGYLRAKFTLPISIPSIDLVEAVCKVAAYSLLSVRGYNPETGSDPNVRDRYKDAIAWLKGVAEGSITPALTDSSPGGVLGGPFVLQAQLSGSASDGLPVVVPGAPRARGW
jgi:phage gp36-like protein